MLKPIIAGITALSLTLATATPSAAQGLDREDVGKLLVGLAALAVIGAAIDENRDRDSGTSVSTTRQWSGINHSADWSGLADHHDRVVSNRRVLPNACLVSVETRYGTQRMFGSRCLENNYRHASRLPERCEVRVFTNRGPRTGFDPQCLREQGFRSDRHH